MKLNDIFGHISNFFKHELNNLAIYNKTELRAMGKKMIAKYQDGKSITKILMGINNEQVNWKTYGEHSYWMRYKHKNYR